MLNTIESREPPDIVHGRHARPWQFGRGITKTRVFAGGGVGRDLQLSCVDIMETFFVVIYSSCTRSRTKCNVTHYSMGIYARYRPTMALPTL